MELSESMKTLAESKLHKLTRLLGDIPEESISIRVVMNSAPENSFNVKMDADISGEQFFTEEPGFELETALVGAVEELFRQYNKRKAKREQSWETNRDGKVLTEEDLEKMASDVDEYDYTKESTEALEEMFPEDNDKE